MNVKRCPPTPHFAYKALNPNSPVIKLLKYDLRLSQSPITDKGIWSDDILGNPECLMFLYTSSHSVDNRNQSDLQSICRLFPQFHVQITPIKTENVLGCQPQKKL